MPGETTTLKRTKIVATIGPASDTEEQLQKLINSGMNVARFNTKHNTAEWHHERIKRVKEVAAKMNTSVATLLDLQGPEVRINLPYTDSFEVDPSHTVTFAYETTDHDDSRLVLIPYEVYEALSVGDSVMIDDGIGEFLITEKNGSTLSATAVSSFEVKDRKTLNTPGVNISVPSLIDKDFVQLDHCIDEYVDFIALSFVRDTADIDHLKAEMDKRGLTAKIVAKIENQSAIDNLESIIEAADAVMVARGDLAVEVPFEELTHWQKTIILECRRRNKPVITATQMLKSMVENPRPTRAEVSDVANAVYDGTDAIMLSEETTIGNYPVKAVQTQAKISLFNEKLVEPTQLNPINYDSEALIVHTAYDLLMDTQPMAGSLVVDKVFCLTETGRTARLFSRFRSKTPLYALTRNDRTYATLSLSHGVIPVKVTFGKENGDSVDKIMDAIRELELVETGDVIVLIRGQYYGTPGQTNQLTIIEV